MGLARAENAFALCTDQSEKEQLRVKRDKLADQLEEAKKLKQNITKRSFTVLLMLRKYLSEQLLANYDKFIKTKARLIMETRLLNDKVALSEEQKNPSQRDLEKRKNNWLEKKFKTQIWLRKRS